jgi:hypothetical protein
MRYLIYRYLFLVILFLVFFQCNYAFNMAEAKLSIDLKVNPDKVNSGEKSVLAIFIKNEGNSTTKITGIEIVSPLVWQYTKEP